MELWTPLDRIFIYGAPLRRWKAVGDKDVRRRRQPQRADRPARSRAQSKRRRAAPLSARYLPGAGAPPLLVANISIRIRPIAWGDDALAAVAVALGSGDRRLEAAVTTRPQAATVVR
jgi:hypothetical protein